MSDAIRSIIEIPVPFNMIVLVMLFGTAAGVINTIAKQVRIWACHRQHIEFKRDMLDRGMSVEEIARVIESTAPPDARAKGWGAGSCKK